jgi:hypothetical protein
MPMKKLLTIVSVYALLMLLMPAMTWGACDVTHKTECYTGTTTKTVIDCENSAAAGLHVQWTIDSASDGDTVIIPAGTCTWDTKVSIPDSLTITIKGASKATTLITCTTECLDMGEGSNRLQDITFIDGKAEYSPETMITVGGTGWVIYNIKATNSGGYYGTVHINDANNYHAGGVVSSCEFETGRVLVQSQSGHGSLANANVIAYNGGSYDIGGEDNIVYVEGNTYTHTLSSANNAIDSNYGAKYVFRFNTVTSPVGLTTGTHLESHMQGLLDNTRGTHRWEIYNNAITNNSTALAWPISMRSGSGVIFNNTATGTFSNKVIHLDNYRSYTEVGMGKCDGDVGDGWDGNIADQEGYPCRDQIGRGIDGALWAHGDAYNQPLMPAYFWNNKYTDTNADLVALIPDAESQNHIKTKRDFFQESDGGVTIGTSSPVGVVNCGPNTGGIDAAYPSYGYYDSTAKKLYRCTAENTWTEYFTPAQCPHPLIGTGTCNYAVIGVGGYRTSSGMSIGSGASMSIGSGAVMTLH